LKSFPIIRGIVSAFLLCVFALGITPKQVLHDALTHHQHIPGKEKNGALVSKDRFNCDEENFVAESPFVDQDNTIILTIPETFQVSSNLFFTSYFFLYQFFFELRGPPALV
jgi:hypothetical protein